MKLIGLDQASKVTGYGIFKDGELVRHGVIECSGETDERMRAMFRSILRLIADEKPDVVCIEGTHFQNNQNAYKLLAQLQGMLMGICDLAEIPLKEYSPSLWRSKAGILERRGMKRDELKKLAVDWVKERFNIDCSNDEAEGIVISYVGYNDITERMRTT